MPSIALSIVLFFLGLSSAHAQEKLHCESQTAGGDARDFTCPLISSGTSQHFRFKADFSGSHDDTTMSMTATLNGEPLTCEKGSTTSRRFEDGDVSLDCRFSTTGTARVLGVALIWSHAQYVDFEFSAD